MNLQFRFLFEVIARQREKLGLTQGELAKLMGWTSPQSVSQLERGLIMTPSSKTVLILAYHLGLDCNDLIVLEEAPDGESEVAQ